MFLWLLKLRRLARSRMQAQARVLPSLSLSELLLILVLMWAPAWLPVL